MKDGCCEIGVRENKEEEGDRGENQGNEESGGGGGICAKS